MTSPTPRSTWTPEEIEAAISCLEDDAAGLRDDNPDCEIAANMDTAASMLTALVLCPIAARAASAAPAPSVGAEPVAWAKTQHPIDGYPTGGTQAALITTSRSEAEYWQGNADRIITPLYAAPSMPAVQGEARPLPEGYVLIGKGALQAIFNALQRDAEAGRSVRGELADAIRESVEIGAQKFASMGNPGGMANGGGE